ncbi:hypothetical protein [Candidatus Entotheonella palauensis]|uniref:hypothetical protein n=1 Tax=Candidatus Entotheonella palauensis TaxID=93172 RepID=UPI0011782B6C|nr:hypothetical protein [Candidatus Entotheonella palauensis]
MAIQDPDDLLVPRFDKIHRQWPLIFRTPAWYEDRQIDCKSPSLICLPARYQLPMRLDPQADALQRLAGLCTRHNCTCNLPGKWLLRPCLTHKK